MSFGGRTGCIELCGSRLTDVQSVHMLACSSRRGGEDQLGYGRIRDESEVILFQVGPIGREYLHVCLCADEIYIQSK